MEYETYADVIDAYNADNMGYSTLTDYIKGQNIKIKEIEMDPIGDMQKIFENKADGGMIGIEVLFGPKRDEFSIGGKAKKNQPYDARASIMDYATALDKVSGGTQAQKAQSLTDYGKNILAGLDTSTLNPATRSLAASYGVGKPISKFEDLGPGVGQALQGAIMRTLQDPRAEGISLKNIPVSSYTSYFGDRGAANTQGIFQTGYNSILDQARDMTAALAGDPSAIARTTLGRFNVDIDPEARTGLIRDRYDFSKQMPGSTPYDLNIALPQKFVDEILSSPEYQKITGYKPPQTRTPLSESDFYSQFYGVPYKGFENKFFKTVQKGDPNYDAIRAASSAGSFSDLVDRGIIQAYTGPTDYKNYLSTFADGGRVPMVSGGALKGLMSLFKGGKDKIDDIIETKAMEKIGFRSRDDIPLSTYSEMKGPIKLSDMENIPEDQLKKILRTQELGLYEETPELLKAANLLERFTKKVGGKRVIDYERAEAILGVKLKGNETLDDLFKIEFETRPEMRADGGRVGLFMGGPPLTGTALDIYNSMSAYGFSDAEIADALRARGLYDVAPVETPVINTAPNIINQDRGGDGQNNEPPGFDLGYSSENFGLGPNQDVVDYEAEAYNIGPTFRGQFAKTRLGIQNLISKMRSLPTPLNIALNLAGKVGDFLDPQKETREAIAREELRDLQDRIDKGQFGSPTPTPQDKARGDHSRSGGSKGTGGANPYGGGKGGLHAKDGGLATMFKTRRR